MKNVNEFIEECEEKLKEIFKHYDKVSLANERRVLDAFRNNHIALRHFSGSTGYGYDDNGRDNLAKLFAEVFGGETAIVSPLITCGSHAVAMGLLGTLKTGDTMLSITGKPYDTLDEVIFGDNNGGFKDYKINYHQIDLKNNEIDEKKAYEFIEKNQPKMVFMQKSRGYEVRKAITLEKMRKIIEKVKKISPNSIVFVDNNYGEFLEEIEPCHIGADVCVGSLIKNAGGGIAPTGAYIIGTKKVVNMIASRFTSPSLKTEVGSYEMGYRLFYQGLFLAPHTVNQAVKGSYLIGEVMKRLGYQIVPNSDEICFDIVKSVKFENKKDLIEFVQLIQKFSPVDSDAVPLPWDMPGYTSEVIMAAGTFVGGASIELSCDSPIREPYMAHFQGGLTYEHIKIVAIELAKKFGNFEE